MDPIERMREDWDRRAREDANFYAGFGRRGQDDREFLASAAETVDALVRELVRLPPASIAERRALEIGCGPGRLMLPMSAHFGKIHGIDISPQMAAIARARLRDVPHARVHVTAGDGLTIFGDAAFDFIYSYLVFQHIPDPGVILNYLRESRRVLKPGGVLCCQLRGAPPLASEVRREPETWTGCWFTGERMAAFAREEGFPLVALSGLDTQYMWTTWVKSGDVASFARGIRTTGGAATLKAVTAAEGGGSGVPARGPGAAVSLWLEGLPAACHLGNLEVAFGERRERGCYLSPRSPSGACQLNARLPDNLPPGRIPVALYLENRPLSRPVEIDVAPPGPRRPRVISVSDGIGIASGYRVEMGGVKVNIEDIESPEEVSFTVDGLPALFLQFERKDPIRSAYEFAFHLSPKTRMGMRTLSVRVSGVDLPPIAIEIAGLSEEDGARRQQRDPQHDRQTHQTGDAPLPPAIECKRDLARAIARWFRRQKP